MDKMDKKGIVLIKFMLTKGTPSINMELALDHYLKAHESEVLLPPYLALEFEDVPLSEDEMKIVDRYLERYKITNKSRWFRETVLGFIHKNMEDDYPTLFGEHDMRR